MHFVDPSREVLAETLLAAGPDAPTLCRGWRTRDLAAHLYLRERKAAVGLGLIIKSLSKASDKATAKLAAKLKTGRRLHRPGEHLPWRPAGPVAP